SYSIPFSSMAYGNGTAMQTMATTVFEWAASTSMAELTDLHIQQLTHLCDLQSNRTNNSTGLEFTTVEPKHERSTFFEIWVVGLSFVTVINMCAVVGIGVMRYLSKSVYNQVITFMVGLGVGSLSGSSLYHLLPQAHPQLLDQVDEDGNPTHAYLDMAHFSLIGVYTFFLADKLIKIILQWRKKGSRCTSSDWNDERKQSGELSGRSDRALLHDHLNHKGNGDGCANEIEMYAIKDSSCKSMGDQAHGMCSHEHQIEFGAGDSAIAAVAWMILFGDGLHNLIDGISIGASFADNLRSGLSVSLAVLAEEFPHELGDVAILVASGLTLKQALVYNLLSALTCYIGFFIGVKVGDLDPENTKYLFALAGGMFLYIALSCMMPEMKKAMEEALNVSITRGLYVFFLQASGLFSGLFLMFAMARWGDKIEGFFK
ncbi:zipt-15, partial [Pristionchus pacificus]